MSNRNHDTRDTGIPTRAIHESYLEMQSAHRQYRRAQHDPSRSGEVEHAGFQEAVLTFYELIRPHLRRKSGMGSFWEGKLPKYPNKPWEGVEHAKEYCMQHGTAVWNLQRHVQTISTSPNAGSERAVADGGGSLEDWHSQLNLTDKQRIVALEQEGAVVTWIELRAVSGLKKLDSWDTLEVEKRKQGQGFMAGETATTVDLNHVPVWKLTTAKRLLAEATDKMNLLSHVEIDHQDGAILNFDQSREGARAEYREVDYSSSPDI